MYERQTLGRDDSEVTSTGGCAGSADLSSPVCYYNQGGVGVYSKLGHAEAVSIPRDVFNESRFTSQCNSTRAPCR